MTSYHFAEFDGKKIFYREAGAKSAPTTSKARSFLYQISVFVQIRKLLPEMSYLWGVVVNDIRVVRMASCVILVISLCRIKCLQWHDLSDYLSREDLGLIELGNVGFSNSLLFVAIVENRRSILTTFVRALPIELCRIVGD